MSELKAWKYLYEHVDAIPSDLLDSWMVWVNDTEAYTTPEEAAASLMYFLQHQLWPTGGMADAQASNPCVFGRKGSSPLLATMKGGCCAVPMAHN